MARVAAEGRDLTQYECFAVHHNGTVRVVPALRVLPQRGAGAAGPVSDAWRAGAGCLPVRIARLPHPSQGSVVTLQYIMLADSSLALAAWS